MPTLKASVAGIELIKQARKRIAAERGWAIESQEWLDEASKFLPLVECRKNLVPGTVSIGTWKRFLQGKPVKAHNFRAFCMVLGLNWEDVVDGGATKSTQKELAEIEEKAAPSCQDWGDAPDVSIFFGRNEELARLEGWIVTERCKLVAILGMRGVGKSKLSAKLGKGIQEEFEYIIWRSLLHSPSVEEILADSIEFLSDGEEVNLPNTLNGKILRLINYLSQHRCLLILDNVEAILQGNQNSGLYREGYEGYEELFRTIGEVPHSSCLLLNSREKPKVIAKMEGANNPVRFFNLGGLNYLEGRDILTVIGSFSGSDAVWRELIEFYNGNPLSLKLAAHHIQEVFAGNIANFIAEGQLIFNDMEELLDWHFQRLSDLEQEVMYWFAINREPVSLAELREDLLSPIAKKQLPSTLQSLGRKLPLERLENREQFKLLPVLIEYMTEKLIEQICQEIETDEINLFNHHALLKAQAKDSVRNMEVRLIFKPVIERLIYVLKSQENFEDKLKQILARLREESPANSGYGGGNIINLLIQMGTDLTGYDFSHLTIRQGYFQNTILQEVNLAHSHLDRCLFTQSFSSILSVAFSPNGELIAIGDGSGNIRIWNVANGQELKTFKGNDRDRIWSLAFSPNGEIIASGSGNETVKIWDVKTGQCVKILEGHPLVMAVAFSPNGEIIATGSGYQTIKLWDVNKGKCLKTLTGHTNILRSLAFTPDGEILASSGDDRTIKLWHVKTGKCLKTFQEDTDEVWSVAFSPNRQILVSGCDDKTVRLWDINAGNCLIILPGHTNRVRSVCFSPDGEKIVSGSDDQTIKIWDKNTGKCLKTLLGHNHAVQSVAFNPNGQTLVSGSYDQTVRIWDVNTGDCLKNWQGYTNWIMSVVFSPNSQILASGCGDGIIRLWNLNGSQSFKTLVGHTSWVLSVAFSPDGQFLVSGGDDKTVRLWDVNTCKCLNTLEEHSSWVRSVAFSPDGQKLASSSEDKTVKIWDVETGKCLNSLPVHTNIWSVTFSPDGQILAGGGEDKVVRLWHVQTGECFQQLRGHTHWIGGVVFSRDGEIIASGCGDMTIKLWHVKTGECLKTLQDDTLAIAIALTPNGQILVSGGGDTAVKLWDVERGECFKILSGHTSWIRSVAVSPDGERIASGSQDDLIKIWDIRTGECVETLKAKKPYENLNITGIMGLTNSQKATLKVLGAIENYYF